MTPATLAGVWGTSPARVRRWCRSHLLPATRTRRGWLIAPHARPPWRDGPMIVTLLAGGTASVSAFTFTQRES